MGGLASRRCDACREVALISDRGVVKTVGATRAMGSDRDGTERAICPCGTVVEWPRKQSAVNEDEQAGPLAGANPARFATCAVEDHVPLVNMPSPGSGGRVVTTQNICIRCGLFYGKDQRV
jgi:hypothetical protein